MPSTISRSDYTFIGAFIFGMGLIGMLDGIVFHQILQWHSTYMLTNRFNQIVSDGLLHLITTGLMVTGAILLWTDPATDKRLSNPRFLSGLFFGAGTFNFMEGVIDHHLLQIHHVRHGHPYQTQYDLAFDLFAILLLFIGGVLYRMAQKIR
ncbi:DUF2243 domain-containing protein [Alicyclobacillus fastidiosus]|uniref:DUF2243 domain-containing protein n=1 Tax=Alicyclobacillus fastidiosus TaxID=392011 RepID=A0ABY6ZM92_9BACL|nr:DUF2243 domain-containing protein [Alicyclobacillus fastidiosus]WAH44048.1 DUF2243 domain-containing protein [Alicyclobacillus fastidiosus]